MAFQRTSWVHWDVSWTIDLLTAMETQSNGGLQKMEPRFSPTPIRTEHPRAGIAAPQNLVSGVSVLLLHRLMGQCDLN